MEFPSNSHDEQLNKLLHRIDFAEGFLEEWFSYGLLVVKHAGVLIPGKRLSKVSTLSKSVVSTSLSLLQDPRFNNSKTSWGFFSDNGKSCTCVQKLPDYAETFDQLSKTFAEVPFGFCSGAFAEDKGTAVLTAVLGFGNMSLQDILPYYRNYVQTDSCPL